jgi:hypothetical protein
MIGYRLMPRHLLVCLLLQSPRQLILLIRLLSSQIELENPLVEARWSFTRLPADISVVSVQLAPYCRAQLLDDLTGVARERANPALRAEAVLERSIERYSRGS